MERKVQVYRDFWLRLGVSIVLAFFFVFLGTDSLADITKGKYFVADLLCGFTLSFIVTTYINFVTAYLDAQYPWSKYFTTRLVYQLIAGVLLASMFVLAFMYTYLIVVLGFAKEEVAFFNTEFPISVLFIIFWNVIYLGYYFYQESRKHKATVLSLQKQLLTLQNIPTLQEKSDEHINEDEINTGSVINQGKIKILVAVAGNKNIPIPVETIAYFFKTGNYTSLKTFQSETWLLNHSLDELMKLVDGSIFFRANRQFIINLKACHFFTNEENGKLAVQLLPDHEEEVIISQKRASAFKEWLNK